MPAPLKNNPLGMQDQPDAVGDPQREAVVMTMFNHRLQYVRASLELWQQAIGSDQAFNASLKELRRSVRRKRFVLEVRSLHREIATVVLYHARRHADQRDEAGPLLDADREAGTREAAKLLKARGKPTNRVVRHHVEGLMALMLETTGRPVRATRYKNGVYAPQGIGVLAHAVIHTVRDVVPSVSETTIVQHIEHARKEYARKPMRFADFFPGFGMQITPF